ncbi:SAM-dependent methyltransferase [Actinomadura sp. ATCC 31491]|uniref:S-adenosyl-L-methionine-dependent methyltransferase n=1 Tax=Actinomadura luzonensis TaxID=2805427 RepID=A0ABT0FUP2_9ACTN|nr:SAM-dependent methyltransferase [Actinomadura luzonensis]MCK2215984.1 SAM-dependent methyltransferase [Actinomadura luzonensis]
MTWTAFGPMMIAACERFLPPEARIVDDDLAPRLLPPALRLLIRLPAARRALVAGSERRLPGIWASVLCRKRYADDQVRAALEAGVDQVVVLGAGLDTRACRLAGPKVRAFELDLPDNVARKRRRLTRAFGRVPEGLTLVPIDFDRGGLARTLATAGFRADRPAVFVWEAVTQYLSEDGVRATLASLSRAAPGSRLLFTYVRRDFLDGVNLYGGGRMRRDFVERRPVFRFGLLPEEVAGLLAPYGWAEAEQAGPAEYAARYLRPSRRDRGLSAPTEIERFVLATTAAAREG